VDLGRALSLAAILYHTIGFYFQQLVNACCIHFQFVAIEIIFIDDAAGIRHAVVFIDDF